MPKPEVKFSSFFWDSPRGGRNVQFLHPKAQTENVV